MAARRRRLDLATGWAEWEETELVGNREIPRRIDVHMPSVQGMPALTMVIELKAGYPQCTRLSIEATESGREVRTTDVRAVAVEDWVEQIVAATSLPVLATDDEGIRVLASLEPSAVAAATKTVRALRKSARRKVTDDTLSEVARIYRANAHDRPVAAVGRALALSPRSASRYVQRAREAGLLPPTTQGKVSV